MHFAYLYVNLDKWYNILKFLNNNPIETENIFDVESLSWLFEITPLCNKIGYFHFPFKTNLRKPYCKREKCKYLYGNWYQYSLGQAEFYSRKLNLGDQG